MSAGNNVPTIEKLKGADDYNDWAFAMQAYLEHEGLWDCVTGDSSETTNETKMAKAKAKLILSVERSNFSHIKNATTAKEIWENLKTIYEDSGLTRKVGLLKTLVTTRLENCASTEDFVDKICCMAQKLNSLGFNVGEEWLGALMLAGLPPQYKPMIMGIESSGVAIKGATIKTKLLQDVQFNKKEKVMNESESAFYSKKKNYKNFNRNGTNNNNKTTRCFNCNGYNHIAKYCKNKKQDKSRYDEQQACPGREKQNEDDDEVVAWITNDKTSEKNQDWYIDSGATRHMSPTKENFLNFKEVQIRDVKIGDGSTLKAEVTGDVKIKVLSNYGYRDIILKDCLYVPKLQPNLVSVLKITSLGYEVSFLNN